MSMQPRSTGQQTGTQRRQAKLLDRTPVRLSFLLLGGIALLAGVDAALLLLGLGAPVVTARLAEVHGPLMVFGFVGTVVVLERAVATRRWWAFFAPGLLGLGGLAIMSPLPLVVGKAAFVVGSLILVAIYAEIWRKQTSTSTAVQALGAFLAVMATVLWLGGASIPQIVPAMGLFLILTIGGERLELARISPTVDERAERWLLIAGLGLTGSAVAALIWPVIGFPLLGAAMLGFVVWLFRYDVATKLIRAKGLPRYMAICLLVGYVWLVVAGGIWLTGGPVYSGPAYDAVLHAVFLGFVISMIMAHAPTILPAVLRRPLPYRPVMYVPVILLHASLLLRTLWGDARGDVVMVQWGGVVNIVALLLFVVIAVVSVLVGAPRKIRKPVSGADKAAVR
ncbi:MAG TPA: hypothetical protein VIR33_10465 [Thermopolyspora sp.]